MAVLHNDWGPLLAEEFAKPYYLKLRQFLKREYAHHTVYPDMYSIFNALHYTPYESVKVVILGQDPYHGPGQAHGLSFSVRPGTPAPPSLQNIFKELRDDTGAAIPEHGYLLSWTEQGVLLLNTVLTVRQSQPNSHKGKGWESFTDEVIRLLGRRDRPVAFMLWGANAQAKRSLIDVSRGHLLIESPHPSPLSAHRGFLGSRPFSRANRFLRETGQSEIDWNLPQQAQERPPIAPPHRADEARRAGEG